MKWRPFFIPVQSMDTALARELIAKTPQEALFIIDVRQPGEYEQGHIPGARLIPVGELDSRVAEIPVDKPVLVYCAMGGRSRMAAQILSGRGFPEVIDLAGGFKAWKGVTAVGLPDQGLSLFSGSESIDEVLAAAYSIEDGLRDFYHTMAGKAANHLTADLFEKLAAIEVKHQDRIYETYMTMAERPMARERFVAERVDGVIEGGMTTDEYIARFSPDMTSTVDIISLAISIEAQAMDLYSRASEKIAAGTGGKALALLADEERAHIRELGKLLDTLVKVKG
ncbi:MAG: rhodanese-like domain-containing protein [Thermodesulfobacteriota bacterium]